MFMFDLMFLAYHSFTDKYTMIMMESEEISADFSLSL